MTALAYGPARGRVVLIGGGARSGKSAFALERARRAGPRLGFIATAQAFDDEMRARIAAHRRERGAEFATVEEPMAIIAALRQLSHCDAIVVDCLTLWLSNLLLADCSDERIAGELGALCAALCELPATLILVTNEVGLGLVPETALGRRFRDLAGATHRRLASLADEVYLGALGVLLRLRPSPVEALTERGGTWT